LERFSRGLAFAEEAFIGIGIIVPSFVLFFNVILRYVFNSGWVWAEEVARYLIVWMVFVGGSCCVRRGVHLAVDAVVIRFSARVQSFIKVIVSAICIAFCAFMVIYGWEICTVLRDTDQITPGLEMPVYLVYLAIPAGGALMGFRFFEELVKNSKAIAASDKEG
jgi:C4-dicarboxylate transporter DctQ subunit